MERAIVFEITGKYGLFKKPYSPLSPVSFPVPPPTAIFGMVGAIAGFGKDEYLEHINDGEVQVGIRLRNSIRRYRAGLNLLVTKGSKYFRPVKKNPRTQIPAEFLVDPKYRIYFAHSNSEIIETLEQQLKADETVYTPCLGIAQCIADVNYIGSFPIEKMKHRNGTLCLDCVIPLSRTRTPSVHYKPGAKLFRFRLPAMMAPDRTVTHYEDVVVNENAEPVEVTLKDGYERIGGDDILLFPTCKT
mgnify:CR=1 FL=1